MNKRIKELMIKSVDHACANQQSMDTAMEKLAELIIQECANFIDNWEEYQIKMSEQVHGFIPPTGGSDHLKEYFGI